MDGEDVEICLCFPCILHYLGGYVFPEREMQRYPILERKGFTKAEQTAIADEWYWTAVERDSAVKNYLAGEVALKDRDGHWFRPPPTNATVPPSPSLSKASPSDASSVAGSNT